MNKNEIINYIKENVKKYDWFNREIRDNIIQYYKNNIDDHDFVKQVLLEAPQLFDEKIFDDYILYNLKNNKEFILELVSKRRDGMSITESQVLKYASEDLRSDKDIVIAAIANEPTSIQYADEKYRNNIEIANSCLDRIHDEIFTGIYCMELFGNNVYDNKDMLIKMLEKTIRYDLSNSYGNASERLKSDEELFLKAMNIHSSALYFVDKNILKNEELFKKMLGIYKNKFSNHNYGNALEYFKIDGFIPERLKNDKDTMLFLITQNPNNLRYASQELLNDKDFILEVMNYDTKNEFGIGIKNSDMKKSLKYASDNVKRDKDIWDNLIKWAVRNDDILNNLTSIEDKMLYMVKYSREFYYCLPEEFKHNKTFAKTAINKLKGPYEAKEFLENNVLTDEEIFKEMCPDKEPLYLSDEEKKQDKNFVKEKIREEEFNIQFLPESLKYDEEFLLDIIWGNNGLFKNLDESLTNNKEFVKNAVYRHQGIYRGRFISDDLYKDRDIVLAAVKGYTDSGVSYANEIFEYFYNNQVNLEFLEDREVVLEAVKRCGNALFYASPKLKNDPEIAMSAIENDKNAIKYVGDKFAYSYLLPNLKSGENLIDGYIAMKSSQYKECADIAAEWWLSQLNISEMDKVNRAEFDEPYGNMIHYLSNVSIKQGITEEQASIFKESLSKFIQNKFIEQSIRDVTIYSDYRPEPCLANAANEAGITCAFPYKTLMKISKDKIEIKAGISANIITIWDKNNIISNEENIISENRMKI